MSMQIRGATQIKDESIPLGKLDPSVQEKLQREEKRANFAPTTGQTVLSHADFAVGMAVKVHLNGALLQPDEYTVGAGSMTLAAPAQLGDQITVLYGTSAAPGIVPAHVLAITQTQISNWDAAHTSLGDIATALDLINGV